MSAVLAIGIFFIVYGAYRGEVETVFSKAVRICLECVGLDKWEEYLTG
ncbi:CD1871A family CXXC motif-containing protein [Suipraeoptans intestinalis]|nr:CD1871A family CXXC motif-containing protein [Suipraeoptans intestinalis]